MSLSPAKAAWLQIDVYLSRSSEVGTCLAGRDVRAVGDCWEGSPDMARLV